MLNNIKKMFSIKETSLDDSVKIKHYVEVYLQVGCSIEKLEFELPDENHKKIIDHIIHNIDNFDRIIKVRFYDKSYLLKKGKFSKGIKNNFSNYYYFGKVLTILEVSQINKLRGIYENTLTPNEYQVGGVLHRRSGMIFPLYTNDVVIDDGKEMEIDILEEQKKKIKQALNNIH